MPHRFTLSLLLAAFFFLPILRATAAEPPRTDPPAKAAVTLRSFLEKRSPRDGRLILAVEPETAALAAGQPLPGQDDTLPQIAGAFGRTLRDWGQVTAIAPPRLLELNSPPAAADPWADLNSIQLLTLFAAQLTDAQYGHLTSEQGIGPDGLTSLQLLLFRHLLAPSLEYRPLGAETTVAPLGISVPADARLRLSRRVDLLLPFRDKSKGIYQRRRPQPASQQRYIAVKPPTTRIAGAVIRSEIENVLKQSDLDFDTASLKTPVDLKQAKTVGDVISSCGTAAGLELYADRRYASRSVLAIGTGRFAAKDVLRALALCLGASYRKVGTVYILAEAREGIGVRRASWQLRQAQAQTMRAESLEEAALALKKAHRQRAGIPFFGDTLAMTPEQLTRGREELEQSDDPTVLILPFSKLTPAQQHQAEIQEAADPKTSAHTEMILLQSHSSLDALIPGVGGPIQLQDCTYGLFPLGLPDDDLATAWRGETGVAPGLKALLSVLPRRAVYAAPSSSSEMTRLLDAMTALGLTELWLDVLSKGKPHFAPYAPEDLFALARSETRSRHISLFASFDLLTGNVSLPHGWKDRTITDEGISVSGGGEEAPIAPAATGLTGALAAPIQTVAAMHPDAIVWRNTAPPGYAPAQPWQAFDTDAPPWLGYGVNSRLGFIKTRHIDPIDLLPATPSFELPGFDAPDELDWVTEWNDYLCRIDTEFLTTLRTACRPALDKAHIPLILQARTSDPNTPWYGSWEPGKPLPPTTDRDAAISFDSTDGAAAARLQSRIAYAVCPLPDDTGQTSRETALAVLADLGQSIGCLPVESKPADLMAALRAGRAPHPPADWSGYVLDASSPRGIDVLETLAQYRDEPPASGQK